MSQQVASLFATLTLNDSQFRRGLGEAQSGLRGLSGGLQNLGDRMTSAGAALTALTAPIVAFGAMGVRSAMGYEDALREIEVRAGLTAEQLEAVRAKTLEIGRDSVYGPGQAADAFLQLLTSGSTVEEAMIQIDAVIAGAAASGQDLGYTADALTDIMAAMGVEVENSTQVMQALISASGASSATFPDLVQGFSNVGGMARQMGLDVEETSAILAVFSENGIKGAEGGTQLRSMLNNMMRDTPRVQGAWERLGTSLFDQEGNIRDLNLVVQEMNAAMADMSAEEQTRIIQDLAGSYGQLGLTALLANDGYGQMQARMLEGADIADVASARLDTFSGALALVQGSVETLQIEALTPFMNDVLAPMVLQLNDVILGVTEWARANPELTQQIVGLLAGAVTLGPALMIVGQAAKMLGAGLAVVLSPAALLIAAIGGIMYAANELYPGGLVQLFSDATTAAQQLAIMGLGLLSGAANWLHERLEAMGFILPEIGEFMGVVGERAVQLAQIIGLVLRNAFIWVNEQLQRADDFLDGLGVKISNFIDDVRGIDRELGRNEPDVPLSERIGAGAGGTSGGGLLGGLVEFMSGARAEGGRVAGGMPYMVGERGPELFVPERDGAITPNHALGGNTTINVYQQPGENGEAFARRVVDLMRMGG